MMSRGSRSGVWYPCQGLEDQCILVGLEERCGGGGSSGVAIWGTWCMSPCVKGMTKKRRKKKEKELEREGTSATCLHSFGEEIIKEKNQQEE